MDRTTLGRVGEDAAARFYEAQGFVVVGRNFRCRGGEVDIVARRGRDLVFCEVKTRASSRWGEPFEAVGYVKQQRLRCSAARWLSDHKPGRVNIRFDVVSVIVRDSELELHHLPNAF